MPDRHPKRKRVGSEKVKLRQPLVREVVMTMFGKTAVTRWSSHEGCYRVLPINVQQKYEGGDRDG